MVGLRSDSVHLKDGSCCVPVRLPLGQGSARGVPSACFAGGATDVHPGSRARWRQALRTVTRVERRSSILPSGWGSRGWDIHGRIGLRAGMEVERLPEVLRPRAELTDRLLTATRADVVAIGKFDVEREVRLRAFYERTGLSLRYQSGGAKSGIARTLSAH